MIDGCGCFEPSVLESRLGSVGDTNTQDVLYEYGYSMEDIRISQDSVPDLTVIIDWC
jgi:hypothetical protein